MISLDTSCKQPVLGLPRCLVAVVRTLLHVLHTTSSSPAVALRMAPIPLVPAPTIRQVVVTVAASRVPEWEKVQRMVKVAPSGNTIINLLSLGPTHNHLARKKIHLFANLLRYSWVF